MALFVTPVHDFVFEYESISCVRDTLAKPTASVAVAKLKLCSEVLSYRMRPASRAVACRQHSGRA